ncbi:MAG: hypothetical protein J3K34DRAFT_198018 [Monoraphidium minutum]|nr:MAG: hypothetical protein J3K34DRAFT_198018 [Monoraphidium minutum]
MPRAQRQTSGGVRHTRVSRRGVQRAVCGPSFVGAPRPPAPPARCSRSAAVPLCVCLGAPRPAAPHGARAAPLCVRLGAPRPAASRCARAVRPLDAFSTRRFPPPPTNRCHRLRASTACNNCRPPYGRHVPAWQAAPRRRRHEPALLYARLDVVQAILLHGSRRRALRACARLRPPLCKPPPHTHGATAARQGRSPFCRALYLPHSQL